MNHYATPAFWKCYHALPAVARDLADKKYELLKADPAHPSLRFKQIGRLWAVRIGLFYRALAVEAPGGYRWFWIGDHGEYEGILKRN